MQLGLLPRSVRVGRKGKHRGSQGLYPATIVRQIELVRRLMAQGYTIQDIQREFLFLGSEIEALVAPAQAACSTGVERSARARRASARTRSSRARWPKHARSPTSWSRRLRAIERRLAMRARMARAAV